MKRFKVRQIYLLFILILSGFLITGCGGSGGVTETGHWLPKDVMSIEVTPPNPIIATFSPQRFMATGIYAENAHFDLTSSVTWTSSNTDVATINTVTGSIDKGLATSKAIGGTTTITATDTATGKSGYTTLTVKPPSVTLMYIEVTPPDPTIALGTNKLFIATGIYSDDTTQNLTSSVIWRSETTTVATLDPVTKGLFNSKATGITRITATDTATGKSGYTTLTVKATSVTLMTIEVTPPDPTIALGTNKLFIATGIYSDGATQNLTQTAIWKSENTDIATLDPVTKGLFNSKATGTTTITATDTATGKLGHTTLTVTEATLKFIEVTPPDAKIPLGLKQQFIAMGTYTDGTKQNLTSLVTWSTPLLAIPIASISNAADGSNGLATSLHVGGAITITATVPHTLPVISGTALLTVTAAELVSIEVDPVSATISVGATQQFIATGTFTDGTKQPLTSLVTWTTPSRDPAVAFINNAEGFKGEATALAVGGPIRIHVIDPDTKKFGNAKLTVIAVPPASHLGSAAGFGIMATAAITDVPTSTINGDVSLEPGTSCGLLPAEVNGTIHINDSVSHQARADLLSAYNYYKTLPPGVTIDGGADLGARYPASAGGIPPGTYTSGSTMLVSTPLVLNAGGDANAVWVFQIGSSLTTNVGGGNVTLLGGANPNNVFWVCTEDATIGVNTIFNGTIITGRDATGQTGAAIYGRILAGATLSGTIALDTNTVTVPAP